MVVDDFVPFAVNKQGNFKLAFARSRKTGADVKNELWMLLVEKAWAKVSGSYEAMENGHDVETATLAITGGPLHSYQLAMFRNDIRRGGKDKDERIDKLWKILDEANSKGWVVTATSPQLTAEQLRGMDEDA